MTRHMILILAALVPLAVFAQPANDNCGSPINVTQLDSTCVAYTTTNATNDTYTGSCMNGNNNVWFSFVAQGQGLDITVSGGAGFRPEIALIDTTGGFCNVATNIQVDCISGTGNYTTITLTPFFSITVGEMYYIMVTNRSNGNPGPFNLCVSNPIDPITPGQDCPGALPICSNSTISGNSAGFGLQELNFFNDGCLAGENNSSWYELNIATGGTLEFTITPSNGTDDYDFALWGPASACPPTAGPIRCNYAAHPRLFGCGTNTNPTGAGSGGTLPSVAACDNEPFTSAVNVLAGEVYILVVDGFSAQPDPFDLSFGGTATLNCTLPLDDFKLVAAQEGAHVQLSWQHSSFMEARRYVVERSADGRAFSTLQGMDPGNGQGAYSILDQAPLPGQNHYRVRIEDHDGKVSHSLSAMVWIDPLGDQLLKVYPTASVAEVTVELYIHSGAPVTLQVRDVMGATVRETMVSGKGVQRVTLPLDGFGKGLHFIGLKGRHQSLKVVVL